MVFQGCTKDGSDLLPEGNIVGYVFTINEFNELQGDHSGVTVFTEGVKRNYQTVTDKFGRFELPDVPAGTYKFIFSKNGYGTLKRFGIKHLGGEPTVLNLPFTRSSGDAFVLFEKSSTSIDNLVINGDSVFCDFTFSKPAPEYLRIILSFSLVDNFELEAADFSEVVNLKKAGTKYAGKITFNNVPYDNWETVFFRGQLDAYTGGAVKFYFNWSVSGIINYFDYDEDRYYYPSRGNPSKLFSFKYGI